VAEAGRTGQKTKWGSTHPFEIRDSRREGEMACGSQSKIFF